MIEAIIKFLLKRLAGLTPGQWETALIWVKQAASEASLLSGDQRKEAVFNWLKAKWPKVSTLALNLLIEVAVAWLRMKKII